MTRNDDLRKSVGRRQKRSTLRRTVWTRRARATALSVALGFASLPFLPYDLGIESVYAVSTVTTSSLQAAQSAASKSLYSRQQQQARLEAQRQAETQARVQAENQVRAQRQAKAAQAQAQVQAQAQAMAVAQAESSKKSFLSDLFKREPVNSNSNPYGDTSTFNNYERAQFASKGVALPLNDPKSEKSGLGFSIFKKKDAPEQPGRQELLSNTTKVGLPYVRSNSVAGRPTASRGSAPSSAVLAQPSSSQADSRDALAKVPWDLMPQQTRERLSQLASSPTLYRRLPMSGGACNPELFDFFLTYPNAVVELWRLNGYDGLTMKPEGRGAYSIVEKGGSSGRIQIIYQDSELTLVHCYGSYVSPAFPRAMEGEAFLILQTRYTEDGAKTPLVVCRMDAFVSIKNMGADLLARTFSSVVGKIADSNFENTLGYVCGVSRSIEENPQEFKRVAASLNIDSAAKNVLVAKVQEVANQAQARRSGKTVEYRLLAKANAPRPGYARILARGDSNNSLPNGQSSLAQAPGVARSSSSYGKTLDLSMSKSPSIASNEFALASDGDFETSLEWDDDERMATGEEILASRRSSASTSIAKIGAKTTKNSSVIDLLEEQEESDEPTVQYDGLVSTESEESDDDLLLSSEEESNDDVLTDDSILLDESVENALAVGESDDSNDLTMTLDLEDSETELKDSPVAIPYASQTTEEDETQEEKEEATENDLIAMPSLEETNVKDEASEEGDLLTTLELPEELQDAPVVPLAATTNNPSSERDESLNAMKRASKTSKATSTTELSSKEVKNEEKALALSEKTTKSVDEKKETFADVSTPAQEFKPVKAIDHAPDGVPTVNQKIEDAEFEVVAQEMETQWRPVQEADSTDATFDATENVDGFRAIGVEEVEPENVQKVEKQTSSGSTQSGSGRGAATESEEEIGPVKRFVTRRFSPRGGSNGNKTIPSFRSALNGSDDEGGDARSSFKPIERLKSVVNQTNSN